MYKYQTFYFDYFRAEKSKQLSDELQEADQKVDYLRVALAAVYKRLPQYNTSTQEKENFEKRLVLNIISFLIHAIFLK